MIGNCRTHIVCTLSVATNLYYMSCSCFVKLSHPSESDRCLAYRRGEICKRPLAQVYRCVPLARTTTHGSKPTHLRDSFVPRLLHIVPTRSFGRNINREQRAAQPCDMANPAWSSQAPSCIPAAPTLRERWNTAQPLDSREAKIAALLNIAPATAREILMTAPPSLLPSGRSQLHS